MSDENVTINPALGALVIDDDATSCAAIAGVLHNLGVENVFVSRSSEEAIEKFDARRIDIVFLDWHLPVLNGLDVLQLLRMCYENLPIIIVTGDTDKEKVAKALQAGASYYLRKPVDSTSIANALAHLADVGMLEPGQVQLIGDTPPSTTLPV